MIQEQRVGLKRIILLGLMFSFLAFLGFNGQSFDWNQHQSYYQVITQLKEQEILLNHVLLKPDMKFYHPMIQL
jgi:prophage maintenance system killer protein